MTLMQYEIQEQPEVLKRSFERNREKLSELVRVLKSREITAVVIAARGTSDHAGIYGKYIIEYVMGIPVSLAAPSIYTVYGKKLDLSKCLVLGISQSGRAADVLEVLKSANECGAVTVSITNDPASPLASKAGFHLDCAAGLEKSVAATKTCAAEMFLLAQLVAEWSGDGQFRKELEKVPEEIESIFADLEGIAAKVQRYRFINECFVLSRGMNYPVAMEAALKIQETAYVRARAYASSDFYHGPLAMIEKDMPVIVFAPEGPMLADMVQMIRKLRQNGAEIIVVSNSREALALGECRFEIPGTANDLISPFYNLVIAQLFAMNLSLIKGLNPDAPRSLSKVTITK